MVLWYPLRRFILNVTFFSPRICSSTSPTTVAFATVGAPMLTFPSLLTIKTRSKVTGSPASIGNRSISNVSPAATRYCLLPVSNTAYIKSKSQQGDGDKTRIHPHCQFVSWIFSTPVLPLQSRTCDRSVEKPSYYSALFGKIKVPVQFFQLQASS